MLEEDALDALRWLENMAGSNYVRDNTYLLGYVLTVSVDMILTVLRTLPMHAEIQTGALRVLAIMKAEKAFDFVANERMIINVSIFALKAHPMHSGVQNSGLQLLANVVRNQKRLPEYVIFTVIATSVLALRHHPLQEVQHSALQVLVHLALTGQHFQSMEKAGAITSVVAVLHTRPVHNQVLSRGLLLLGYLSFDASLVDRMVNSGAIEGVVGALYSCRDMVETQASGLLVLINLASSGAHLERITHSGAMTVTLDALRNHLKHPEVEACGLCFLGMLSDHLVLKQLVMAASTVRPVVIAVMQAHPQDTETQIRGSLVLQKLACCGSCVVPFGRVVEQTYLPNVAPVVRERWDL